MPLPIYVATCGEVLTTARISHTGRYDAKELILTAGWTLRAHAVVLFAGSHPLRALATAHTLLCLGRLP